VLWHSFEPGLASFGLDGVITEIGLAVAGTDFARLSPPERLEAVKRLLGQLRTLLLWDNFESVREMPDPAAATPPLGEPGCAQLREFLDWVRDHSSSTVLITSRAQESWLGGVRRIGVGGLNRAEAAQCATYLLAPYPATQRRRELRSFGDLLDWLDGHPLAMRLTLPRLDTTDPAALLADLQGTAPLPAQDTGRGRLSSLAACITYSFAHLSDQSRRLLPAVSLFHAIADKDVLVLFSGTEGVPGRFADVTRDEWTAVLENAARVGLLTGIGAGMYQIHPALPGYLAAGWHAEDPSGYEAERAACEQALRAACAAFSQWLTGQIRSGNAALAYVFIGLQRRTLGAMLSHALDQHAWSHAERIVRALDDYWGTRGLREEAAAWADRILDAATGHDLAPLEPAGSLWLYTIVEQANWLKEAGQPDQATRAYLQALAYLQDQPESGLTLNNVAVLYHQLGMTAQDLGRLEEAEEWYHKSLAIKESLGNRPDMAGTYHQLGATVRRRGQLEEAEDWYRKSLTIDEELGNRPGMAITYHALGIATYLRNRLDEAEDWYRKSLTINQELGNRPGMAGTYHQLGITAQDRGRLDEAEDWYRKSLTIKEELGNRPGTALTYAQLGLLAEDRGQVRQALDWNIRCVTLFGEFPSPLTGTGPTALARLTRKLGMPMLEEAWRQATGQPVPQAVRDYITSRREDAQPNGDPE
jgi:tetratricopeptide (TPR) repeat protein